MAQTRQKEMATTIWKRTMFHGMLNKPPYL